MRLTVKNWHEFQHYKDRAPSWIKLHKGLLDDFDFQCLPLASRALAPMFWLIASESSDGSFDADPKKLAFRLRGSIKEIETALQPLIDAGFLIPASDVLADGYQLACLEERREEDINQEKIYVVSELTPCPHQEIISLFAEILPDLPQVRKWEGTRTRNLKARWAWVLKDLEAKGKPFDKSAGLDFFRRMFSYIAKSDFLTGRIGGFACSLPWIVKDENFTKIIEGNYENKAAA